MRKNKQSFSIGKQKNKKALIITLVVLLALLGASVAVAYQLKFGPFAQDDTSESFINLDEPTKDQVEEGEETKKNTIENDESDGKPSTGSDPLPEPTPVDGSSKESVHAEITAANQTEYELIIRTLIQTITNSGTCNLKITQNGAEVYTATSEVQALPNGTTCKGFDVPIDKLKKGSHRIDISFSNDDLTATTNKTVTVQ